MKLGTLSLGLGIAGAVLTGVGAVVGIFDTKNKTTETLKGVAAANDAVIKAQVDDAVAQAMEKYGL